MISITASGFIAGKPELQLVGAKRSRKCEFAVVDTRRAFHNGEWQDVWERVTFVAWDEEAERIASTLDKGFTVCCTGLQETSPWTDSAGVTKKSVKYRLTAWSIERKPRQASDRDSAAHPGPPMQGRQKSPLDASHQGHHGDGLDHEEDSQDQGHRGLGTSKPAGFLEM